MFIQGQTYTRRNLHKLYGGQQQGGISTPSGHNFIMLFTGDQGQQYGYRDGWNDEGVFLYTGEGQVGDMAFVRGNRAIHDHIADGKDLHLFEYLQRGQVRYVGQMICAGFQERRAPDKNGNQRKVIVFELQPIAAFDSLEEGDKAEEERLWQEPLSVLREKALAAANETHAPAEGKRSVLYRSRAIRIYVLKRADGKCEGCEREAPFRTSEGRPYLEPHHIRRLSDGGPDHPHWVAALCPNCHRQAHYGADRGELNGRLAEIVKEKERSA